METHRTLLFYLGFKKVTATMFMMLSVLILFFGSPREAQSAPTCKAEVARVVSMQGTIEIRRTQENVWQQAGGEVVLCAGDMIRARSQSRAALRLSNNSMLRLDQKTSITFPEVQEERGASLLDLFEGAIHIITRTPQPFKIRTPFVNASVEGTEFVVGLREDNTEVVVYEGKVSVSNELGSLLLHDHEAAVTYKGKAPRKEIIIRSTDAVQWALYYPAILDYWQNDGSDTSTLIHQASQLLTIGQANEAREIIQQVLQLEPNNSNAHALLAIIALVQNEKDQALELASKAVTLDPESAAGHLALSYTQQAHFEIDAALESVQKALASDAQNALIWARLAELQMSVGYLERSLDAARLAVSLNPGLAKTQTVLGFAHLLQIDTQTAKDIFHRAIALDQADPMPRLGLGLALIREGELEAGRIELEIAASLDPANSLIRSYLGKAYFEEKRYPLASTQFDLAKERDPKDPTPWFYDAIQKQTQNRPVEALKDIQKSIELNNNRAVYRSKFLLDRDEAARGSSLARIFENLGFERRAIMETAKSLSFDPANHSAHRFLSDTYANTPRHEIARVSELLQAQLLQPINVNPVQPHMAVADLNIITGTGPSAAGFNEFAPLMERNKSQVVASGIAGNQGILGNEVVLSKLYERTSISLGQFHYETNGFRPNYDQNHNIYNGFLQHALTSKLNIQAEVRRREKEHGDIEMDFNPRKFSENTQRKLNEYSARVGARYSISSNQDLIVSALYANSSIDTKNPDRTSRQTQNNSYQVEAQYLFRESIFNLVMGGGYSRVDSDITDNLRRSGVFEKDRINERSNVYLYSHWHLSKNIIATLGFNYNIFKTSQNTIGLFDPHFLKVNEIDPKFGLQWNILEDTRLRLAWFETVKTDLISQQTIEPTQVAGFNQFFDDASGTQSRRKGAGLDTRILDNVYGGLEASIRDLDVPVLDAHLSDHQKEQIYRSYLYMTLNSNWSIASEFQYEKFTRDKNFIRLGNDPNEIHTVSAPISIKYFNSNGLFSSITGTVVSQDIERHNVTSTNPKIGRTEGSSSFFLLDTMIGYRLPARRGLLSFEAKNIFDENFYFRNSQFYVSEPIAPRYNPSRTFFIRLTLNF
ncbi:tetratricopeptide repeat protein [Nitrosomonas sp.]|uniref:FecR domain-containing protein n=1 Tax=Nitrosomonas sp. TaxID=42353 RepID=UPI0032EF3449